MQLISSNFTYRICFNNNRYHCDVAVDSGCYHDDLLQMLVPMCQTQCDGSGMKLVNYLIFFIYISAFEYKHNWLKTQWSEFQNMQHLHFFFTFKTLTFFYQWMYFQKFFNISNIFLILKRQLLFAYLYNLFINIDHYFLFHILNCQSLIIQQNLLKYAIIYMYMCYFYLEMTNAKKLKYNCAIIL